MLIEDVEKLIKQLQEEQGMTPKEARKEAFKRALEDMDDEIELERDYDRPLGGYPVSPTDDTNDDGWLEGDIADEDLQQNKGFFRRLIDKLVKKLVKEDKDDDLGF